MSPQKLSSRFAICLLLIALFGGNPFASAQNAADKAVDVPLAQQLESLRNEFQKAQTELQQAMRSAKTDEERAKIWKEKNPREKFVGRFWDLAGKNPKDPAALDALMIVAMMTESDEQRAKALDLVLKNHIQSEKMTMVCEALADSAPEKAEGQIREILAKNSHREVQAAGKLALGKIKLESSPQEAEKHFAEVAEKFKDVKDENGRSPADEAKVALFEIRNLGVGKVAPEIQGADVEGRTFKLSEYRGKVVVIDFWGDW